MGNEEGRAFWTVNNQKLSMVSLPGKACSQPPGGGVPVADRGGREEGRGFGYGHTGTQVATC